MIRKSPAQPIDTPMAWSQLQQARSRGDIESALGILANLIENGVANEIFLWGDTAVALGDLRLATQAYKKAITNHGNAQLPNGLLGRYYYVLLQIGTPPLEIEASYCKSNLNDEDRGDEDGLVILALEMDLYYRLGKMQQAMGAAQEFEERCPKDIEFGFNFLTHVRSRVWLILARLAEETGDVYTAGNFLLRVDDQQFIGTELQPVFRLYRALLSNFRGDVGDREIEQRLQDVLVSDFTAVSPPIPASIMTSLQYCMEALKSDTEYIPFLEKALQSCHSNLLARRLILAKSEQFGNNLGRLLLTDAGMWLAAQSPSYTGIVQSHLEQTSRQTSDVEFSFLALGGGSKVGGSSYLINLNGTKILLDIGLDVDTSPYSSYQHFKQNLSLSGIVGNVADLDAVIISHAHLDHIGLLPALFIDPDLPRPRTSSGTRPKLPFYASDATKAIANIMLADTSRQMQSAEDESPLYTLDNAREATQSLHLPPENRLNLFRELGRVEFYESGHILGSEMVMVEKDGFRVLYTGDFNRGQQITLSPAESLRGLCPDVMVMENTYGYTSDKWIMSRAWQEKIFHYSLEKALRRGGVVLLPAFAVGRSQEVLGLVAEHLYQHPDLSYNVFMDGLSREITDCYDQFSQQLTERYRGARDSIQHHLVMVPNDIDQDDREKYISEKILGRPNVVIASSGMLKKGSAAYQYAAKIATDSNNAIFYTGYMTEDSEASDFLGNKSNDLPEIKCEQRKFQFSAHASKEELLQFVLDIQPRAVILVHGEISKNALIDGSLYSILTRFQSDVFSVFLGKEGHRIDYRERRFLQL